MTLGASQKTCVGDSIDTNLLLCAVKGDLQIMKASSSLVSGLISEKNEKFYNYFVNFSSFAMQLGSQCIYQINDCVFRTRSNSYDGFLLRKKSTAQSR